MVIPRARSSGAASISSYFLGALPPVAARAMVRAAVRVVLPWSTWPIVPMFTWGFFLSNFPRAARIVKDRWWRVGVTVVTGVRWRMVEGLMKEDERWVSLEVGLEAKMVEVEGEEEEGEDGEAYGYTSFVEAEAAAEEIAIGE
ncbi:hypothetical protein TorRG33x02_074530 [Trema orientale]|uniref:Uncharacterized protein n=1 Tax=Trema orientale TaxID=63057 RepID=A0A2P5FG31_TREOI|nr:hypothetical protein TorRG33x02_074530 [Trema orientale]